MSIKDIAMGETRMHRRRNVHCGLVKNFFESELKRRIEAHATHVNSQACIM